MLERWRSARLYTPGVVDSQGVSVRDVKGENNYQPTPLGSAAASIRLPAHSVWGTDHKIWIDASPAHHWQAGVPPMLILYANVTIAMITDPTHNTICCRPATDREEVDSRHGEPSRTSAYFGLACSWALRSISIPPPVSAPVALSVVLGSVPLPSLKSLSAARMFASIPIRP
jgi:hypothetical protein